MTERVDHQDLLDLLDLIMVSSLPDKAKAKTQSFAERMYFYLPGDADSIAYRRKDTL